MKKSSRPLLIGVLILVIWTSACSYPAQTPAAIATAVPSEQFVIPTATGLTSLTGTSTPLVPVIPITGENVVQMQCQFCVNSSAHAVFVFPDAAIFDVDTSSPVTCLTAEVVNGKRVLVCHGTQSTSFNLKICSDSSNCLLFPVALQPCPVAGVGTAITTATAITPIFLTPINTLKAPTPKNPKATPMPTQTGIIPSPGTSTIAPPPLPTSTPIVPPPATSTSAPPPADTSTSAPPPPTQPASTTGPTSAPTDGQKKPTKTAKP